MNDYLEKFVGKEVAVTLNNQMQLGVVILKAISEHGFIVERSNKTHSNTTLSATDFIQRMYSWKEYSYMDLVLNQSAQTRVA